MSKMNATELNNAITAWGRKGAEWLKEGQTLAMSAMQHMVDSGDDGFLNRLYLAMPKGSKTTAMAQWILANTWLVVNTAENKATRPFVKDKEKCNDLEAAAAVPWYEFAPEPELVTLVDIRKEALAWIKKIRAKSAKAPQTANAGLLELIESLVDDSDDQPDPLAGVESAPM